MRRFVLYLCALLTYVPAMAQQSGPNIQWQKAYGGSNNESLDLDLLYCGHPKLQLISRDKKHLFIGGTTKSSNGDIGTPLTGNEDMWVAKLDLMGTIIWKATISGRDFEDLKSITETSDGSLLVLGYSFLTTNYLSCDAMLTKLNPNGSIAWKKYYGGTRMDQGNEVIETRDGNYVFIGNSESTDGHLAGYPASDETWVTKIDKSGNRLWSRKYAGVTGSRSYQADFGVQIDEDAAGNLFIASNVHNGTNSDSTTWHWDIMVAQLSSGGSLAWSKQLTGPQHNYAFDLKLTGPNSLVIAGSADRAGGDFPESGTDIYDTDAFLMELDFQGNITSFNRFGGRMHDEIKDLVILPDQSYLTVGSTSSADGYLAGDSLRGTDAWVANIAKDGTVRWARKYGGSRTDQGMSIAALSEDSYLFLGQTLSNDYDVSGNRGGSDLWLVKLGKTSTIKGTVYYDDNGNSTKDASESWAYNVMVNATSTAYDRTTATSRSGWFSLETDKGTYNVAASLPYYTSTARTVTFTDYGQSDSLSIALRPSASVQDLQVDLLPSGPARPGFGLTYKILYRNAGTVTVDNAVVTFQKDSRLTVNSVVPTAMGGTGTGLSWALGSLAPRDSGSITLNLTVAAPPAANNGDTIRSTAAISPAEGDVAPLNNTSSLNQLVVGSYDPNDKQEASGGVITLAQATSGEYLSYLIRFQNTGTDTAFTVSVRDTLDAKLDWSTLEMVSASHPYQLTIQDDNKLHWQFNNILLVDSNRNEAASHGYIAYKIKARSNVTVGDHIRNDASIFFDYNLPVVTNEFVTRVMNTTPDLVMTSSVTPTTAPVGTMVSASFSVTNAGTADAGASTVHFYLSADATLTPNSNGDALLLSYPVPALASGAGTGPVTRLLPIPCTQPAGTYYVFLVADGANVVTESNEENNTASNELTVQAVDLTVTPAAPTICAGTSVTLNAGGATSYSWSPAEGLSATTGASVTASPATTTTYTVTGSANNCTATKTVTVTVTPAVTPAVSISSSGCPSSSLTFTATATNGGSNPEIEWYVDNVLTYTGNPFPFPNAYNGAQVYATLASTAACASPLTATSPTVTVDCIPAPAADLTITSSVSATTAVVGTSVTASFTVTNTGNAAAAASKVLFYRSADAVLTPGSNGDEQIFAYPVSALAAGAGTGAVSMDLPVPCTQPVGTYHIFLVADGENVIPESNENNNRTSNALTVQALEVTATASNATICAGASTTLTASGATSYSWTPAGGLSATTGATITANPAATTTYTVTGTANNCTATKTVTVTVTPAVTPTITINYTGCPANSLSFTATITNGGAAPQVEWFVNNTSSGTGTSFTLNNAANGAQVYARLTSNAACASAQTVTSATQTVNCITTSVPVIDGLEEVRVLPNPTHGALAVRLKLTTAKAVSFRLTDAHGREVLRTTAERLSGTITRTLDLRKEAAGVYYLQVQVGGATFTEKIVRAN